MVPRRSSPEAPQRNSVSVLFSRFKSNEETISSVQKNEKLFISENYIYKDTKWSLQKFEEIEDYDTILKNHYELGRNFNSEYIFSIVSDVEKSHNEEDWEQEIDEENLKVWISTKGSPINCKHPFIYSEMKFSSSFEIEKLKDILTDYEQVVKWNPFIKSVELLDKFASNAHITHVEYIQADKNENPRDFVEKTIIWESEDDENKPFTFVFTSSVPNLHSPVVDGIKRWDTLFNIMILGKDKEGMLLVKSYIQIDPKLPTIARMVLKKYLSQTAKKIYKNVSILLDE